MKQEILLGDNLQIIPTIPESTVNLVIADPPYNISRDTNFSTMKGRKGTTMDYGEWDKNADILSFIGLLPRVLKEGANIVIFNDWKNLSLIEQQMRNCQIEPKRCLVLHKANPAPFNRDRLFVNDLEFAVWGVYKNHSWVFNRQNNLQSCVFDTTVQSRDLHPTMKDLDVIEQLVEILSNKGDTVLDPFVGSGTTGVACVNTQRNFIGIEIDEGYYNIAKKRIQETPLSLF